MSPVERWFGPRFAQLHPSLQALHRRGGTLSGIVRIAVGKGPAGWFGRRLARSLGLPIDRTERGGVWPDGYWRERTGPLELHLTVDVVDGGWQWRALRARFHGLRLPLWLLPSSRAGKRIEDGKYVFHVEFGLPLLGRILSYGGKLDASED